MYFVNWIAANDWLPFDADEMEIEYVSERYPDTFTEWAIWRKSTLDTVFGSGTVVR